MKKVFRKYLSILISAILAISCVGCRHEQITEPPQEEQASYAFFSREQLRSRSLTMYLPTDDFSSVTTQNLSVQLLPYESPAEAAVKTLLQQIRLQNSENSISLISFAVTNQTAIVNLTGTVNALSSSQFFVLAYCLTNTLCELEPIAYVSLLVNDEAVDFDGAYYGVLTHFDQDVETALWQFSSSAQETKKQSAFYSKKMTLYFGSPDDNYLIAESQDVSFVGGYPVFDAIIAALATGPRDTSAVRLLPSTAYLSEHEWTIDVQTGVQALSLRIEGSVYAYWTRNNLTESLAAASVAMTLFDFYPQLGQISISFDRQVGHPIVMRRPQQELRVGTALELYYPRGDGGLSMVRRVVSTFESTSTERIFELMFDRPFFLEDEQIQAVFPSPIETGDILSVAIENETAVILVSERFVQTIRALDPAKERDVLYSVVNTLCRTCDVSRVTFLENGLKCQNLSGRINLSDYLYFNPGIIRE